MDIKQLLRTYTHVNDPKWQNVTVKFAIFAMAGLAVIAAVIAVATIQDAAGSHEGTLAADTPGGADTWECLDPAGYLEWAERNPDAQILQVRHLAGDRICIHYSP